MVLQFKSLSCIILGLESNSFPGQRDKFYGASARDKTGRRKIAAIGRDGFKPNANLPGIEENHVPDQPSSIGAVAMH